MAGIQTQHQCDPDITLDAAMVQEGAGKLLIEVDRVDSLQDRDAADWWLDLTAACCCCARLRSIAGGGEGGGGAGGEGGGGGGAGCRSRVARVAAGGARIS